MEYIVGFTLALFFCGAAAARGMDVHNTGVPASWPGFCMTFDVVEAAVVAWVMRARGSAAAPKARPQISPAESA